MKKKIFPICKGQPPPPFGAVHHLAHLQNEEWGGTWTRPLRLFCWAGLSGFSTEPHWMPSHPKATKLILLSWTFFFFMVHGDSLSPSTQSSSRAGMKVSPLFCLLNHLGQNWRLPSPKYFMQWLWGFHKNTVHALLFERQSFRVHTNQCDSLFSALSSSGGNGQSSVRLGIHIVRV